MSDRARTSKRELGSEFVESLARGLRVLAAFEEAGVPLSGLAEATGLARATVRRSLLTLVHLGYVAVEGSLFRPAPRVLDLGFACLSRLTLPQIARPHLSWLVERVHDSASMAVLAGDDIQYVARVPAVPAVRIMSVDITPGTRFPAYATSMGRVLLAGLPPAGRAASLARADLRRLTRHTVTSAERLATLVDQVARDGYALVDQELEEGLRSVAVPVRDRGGEVVAAVSVSMHAGRGTTGQARENVLPPLREAAARIEDDLHVAGRFTRIPAG
ncbi:helix-turn-helix domain-containing protein [Sphaerisporangium sp. NBC_01403]